MLYKDPPPVVCAHAPDPPAPPTTIHIRADSLSLNLA